MKLNYTPSLADGFQAVALHAGKDKYTPVLTGVQVTDTALLATDRYSVARFPLADTPEDYTAPVLVPTTAVKWLSGHKNLPVGVTLTVESESLTLAYDTGLAIAMTTFQKIGGGYPPVERFIDSLTPSEIAVPFAISAQLLKRVADSALKIDKHNAPLFTQSKTENPAKPGALMATIGNLTMLIQPSLLKNR
jgi:DNA polymerase III sliding clamp (beta) subunit (PCNA family)